MLDRREPSRILRRRRPQTFVAATPTASNSAPSSGPCPAGQTASYTGISDPALAAPVAGTPPPAGFTFESIYCNGAYLETVQVAVGAAPGPGAPTITGAQLAQQAFAGFTIATPVPVLSPSTAIVNFPTWMWLQTSWTTQSATAAVAGLSATVTATPTNAIWTMGDGSQVTCDGPGVAYDPNIADSAQHTDCSHTYQETSGTGPGGRFAATVTVNYATSWTATDGTTGALGTISATANFAVTVKEIEAVNST